MPSRCTLERFLRAVRPAREEDAVVCRGGAARLVLAFGLASLLGAAGLAPASAAANLVRNPGCEMDAAGWAGYRATVSRVTGAPHWGAAACQVAATGSGSYGIDDAPDSVSPDMVDFLVQDATYAATAWVRSTTAVGKPVTLTLRQRGGHAAATAVSSPAVPLSSSWQQLTVSNTIDQPDRTSLDLYLTQSGGAAGQSFQVDDVSLQRAPGAASLPPPGVLRGSFTTNPTDETPVAAMARDMDLIVLTQGDETYRARLRAAGYSGQVLQYVISNQASGPSTGAVACPTSFVAKSNTVADKPGDWCRLTEDMFLHNGAGKRLYRADGGTYSFGMNPGSAAWRSLWVARMQEDAAALGYDGLFLDNLDLEVSTSRYNNWDGTVREYPTHATDKKPYQDALKGMLTAARTVGQPIWANISAGTRYTGSDWDPFLPYLDGALNEAYWVSWDGAWRTQAQWEGMQTQAETVLEQGKGFFGVAQGTQADTERLRFALASYWLITDQQHAYFRYANYADYRKLWDYPEYDQGFGTPLGARYRDGTTGWRRDFSCGHVRVDPTARTYELVRSTVLPTCR
jgi:hypothetical protein